MKEPDNFVEIIYKGCVFTVGDGAQIYIVDDETRSVHTYYRMASALKERSRKEILKLAALKKLGLDR